MRYKKLEGMVPVPMGMTRVLMVVMSTSQMMRQLIRIVLGRDYGRITQMRRVVRFCLFKLTEKR
jgi:hypothetical protein